MEVQCGRSLSMSESEVGSDCLWGQTIPSPPRPVTALLELEAGVLQDTGPPHEPRLPVSQAATLGGSPGPRSLYDEIWLEVLV